MVLLEDVRALGVDAELRSSVEDVLTVVTSPLFAALLGTIMNQK